MPLDPSKMTISVTNYHIGQGWEATDRQFTVFEARAYQVGSMTC